MSSERLVELLKTIVLMVATAVGLTAPAASGDSGPERKPTASANASPIGHYSKEAPYATPKVSIKAPPRGYSMVFIENIGRHGSRASTSASNESDVLDVWQAASDEDALTTTGELLSDDVKSLQAAEEEIGYGNLSTRGKAEWKGIGSRTATSYPKFFESLESRKVPLSSVTTTVNRTKQSVAALESGLTTKHSNLVLAKPSADKDLVNFGSVMSKQGGKDLNAIKNRSDVVTASTNVLKRVYSASYVSSLSSPVDKALDLYELYCMAAGMNQDTKVTFAQYFTPSDAAVMAYARDAVAFYKYGPGVKGENRTYKGADELRTDFFNALDARIKGGSEATVFRVAHGETTMPFAALLQLPGSEKQATKGTPYTYANNPWRGDKIGGMAGNVEWVAYRNTRNHVAVTMRYNEVPTLFRSACKPISKGSYFYTPTELKRCLPKS